MMRDKWLPDSDGDRKPTAMKALLSLTKKRALLSRKTERRKTTTVGRVRSIVNYDKTYGIFLRGFANLCAVFFFSKAKRHLLYVDKRYRKQGKGKFSQGKGGTKTCDDSSIGSCVRASVTEARVMVFVCVHVAKECVHVCERKDVHANCSKMLAAQQKKGLCLGWIMGDGNFARLRV